MRSGWTPPHCRLTTPSTACSRLSGKRLALERDDGLRLAFPLEAIRLAPPYVSDQRRPEARQAHAALVAHARTDHAERTSLEQPFGKCLRLDVRVRIEAGSKAARVAQVVEARAEIGTVIIVSGHVVKAANFSQLHGLVEPHFSL